MLECAAAAGQSFGYSDRNELTGSVRTVPSNTWGYQYDPIGNRTSDVDDPGTPQTVYYQTNELNQHFRTGAAGTSATQGLSYDADGNLKEYYVVADMNCDGAAGMLDIDYFVAAIPDNQAGWAAYYAARHAGSPPPCEFL